MEFTFYSFNVKSPANSLSLISVIISSALLAACGGSGSSSPSDDNTRFSATLVSPTLSTTSALAKSISHYGASVTPRMDECTRVPAGYSPLTNVEVSFLDSDGNTISTAPQPTDECGFFDAPLPTGAASIRAISDSNKELIAGITAVTTSGGIASTIPDSAEYRIGLLTAYGDNQLGFTVTDSVTNKAVVGLSATFFSITVDSAVASFTNLQNGLTSDDASIVMVTDASPSMKEVAFSDTESEIEYTRMNLSAIAAHQFLDQKAVSDEVGMVIFDRDTDFMDQQRINELFDIVDSNGMEVDYPFPASGFTQNSVDLRLVVDAYNLNSKLWSDRNTFELHPDTPQVSIESSYPWRSSTAFYSAAVLASEKLSTQSNPRRVIIAMTDGFNNAGSVRDIDTVIDTANLNGTPVYTIGFESADEEDLTKLASETGATYFKASGLDISEAYSSIQSNIVFQYAGTVSAPLSPATTIELSFDINGDGVIDASRAISR